MKLELKFGTCYCCTTTFIINGIEAYSWDFGDKFDDDPYNAPEYGCGNMKFHPYEPIPEIMEKYNITEKEWNEICDKLDKGLSFGGCAWCE